ncbi:MAG: hypothetical protein C4539_03080 [Ignavibacteriales bacterium]|nr:MAG: hypothetical protein C4539_03080 [Ignavibacteriales bacterium]
MDTPRGTIFSREDADKQFGLPLLSLEIKNEIIYDCLSKSTGFVMFNIMDNAVCILDNKRNPLLPASKSVKPEVVFKTFDIEIVNKLITSGNQPVTFVESRADNVISLTNGNSTLELGSPCPPWCG